MTAPDAGLAAALRELADAAENVLDEDRVCRCNYCTGRVFDLRVGVDQARAALAAAAEAEAKVAAVSPQGKGPGLREAALREATEIIEDIAIVAREDDDSCPLLDELPVELGDRIAAFLNGRPAAPLPQGEGPGLQVERLATIIRSRLGDDFLFADDFTGASELDAEGVAIRLAHLYLTGDVRSGLAPLRAAAPLPRAETPEDER